MTGRDLLDAGMLWEQDVVGSWFCSSYRMYWLDADEIGILRIAAARASRPGTAKIYGVWAGILGCAPNPRDGMGTMWERLRRLNFTSTLQGRLTFAVPLPRKVLYPEATVERLIKRLERVQTEEREAKWKQMPLF